MTIRSIYDGVGSIQSRRFIRREGCSIRQHWPNNVFGSMQYSHELQYYDQTLLSPFIVDSETSRSTLNFMLNGGDSSFALTRRRGSVHCSRQGSVQNMLGYRAFRAKQLADRRFTPAKEGNLWVSSCAHRLKNGVARESSRLPSDVRGIYGYLRKAVKPYILGVVRSGIGSVATRDGKTGSSTG